MMDSRKATGRPAAGRLRSGPAQLRVRSFPPIRGLGSRVLVLGTMPGRRSLLERQYYAHPQNLFWKIVGATLGFDPAVPYRDRVGRLVEADLALWDVLKSCAREGSLDSDIVESTVEPNDFKTFFAVHLQIRRVCFNGAKAEALYLKHVHPLLSASLKLEHVRLPSTSPANASISFAEKARAWRAIVF